MSVVTDGRSHGSLMDGVYRRQRHVYDLTRKYYLLGRDRMIDELDPGGQETLLELGCGTGRNLLKAARRYSQAHFFGLDISSEMLETARASVEKAGLRDQIHLTAGDATCFHPTNDFGVEHFDRIFMSYALSMIPDWRRSIVAALDALAPGGSLHLVDFGDQGALPRWFRAGLRLWLARFHVTPRDALRQVLESEAKRIGASLRYESLFRGYAQYAVVTVAREPIRE